MLKLVNGAAYDSSRQDNLITIHRGLSQVAMKMVGPFSRIMHEPIGLLLLLSSSGEFLHFPKSSLLTQKLTFFDLEVGGCYWIYMLLTKSEQLYHAFHFYLWYLEVGGSTPCGSGYVFVLLSYFMGSP
ncbi:hypothetical protein ACFE04_000413 [Oxalis oulophora]